MNYNFYDLNAQDFPNNANYYFNILIIEIFVHPDDVNDIKDYWDITHILNARPYVYHIHSSRAATKGDPEIIFIPHTIVEINGNKIDWYDLLTNTDDKKFFDVSVYQELTKFCAKGYIGDEDWWSLDDIGDDGDEMVR